MFQSILSAVAAISVIGLVFGIVLSIASKVFAVKTDPKITEVRSALPGANCGACGFPGCDQYAESIAKKESIITLCPVGGQQVIDDLAVIMCVDVEQTERHVARVLCRGTNDKTKKEYDYIGIPTCQAINSMYKGDSSCNFGCLGLGDCVVACEYNAIKIEDGIAWIIEENCVGCMKCVEACPKNIIVMVPDKGRVTVSCMNTELGKKVITACKVGCIACKKCEKICRYDAIHVINGKAIVDYEKCTNCGECIDVCPTKSINRYLLNI
ncbi:MAG: RnfABCDGE type electron transport complex subunit B [Clostridiales bacterium]|nr:RnfABCDGE type electron transport complex subunit B [Clostridiales bacterium]